MFIVAYMCFKLFYVLNMYSIYIYFLCVCVFLRFHAQLSNSVAQPFTKEVILLPDHTFTKVPRRAKKSWLYENGLIKSALEFGCDWDSNKVMQAIMTAFQPLVDGCR